MKKCVSLGVRQLMRLSKFYELARPTRKFSAFGQTVETTTDGLTFDDIRLLLGEAEARKQWNSKVVVKL